MEGPQFEHSVFDVCGHSPLVKYFLKNKDLKHKKQHSTLVKRTEIIEQPPHEAVCYKDVLDQSKEFEKKSQLMFRRYKNQRFVTLAIVGLSHSGTTTVRSSPWLNASKPGRMHPTSMNCK